MRRFLFPLAALILLAAACRKEEAVIMPHTEQVCSPSSAGPRGLYLLNEGNMGSNSCTLDWMDFRSGIFYRNIFPSRNPGVSMELGDVGNDIAVYGAQLWAVINCSNLVEVMRASDAVHIGQISIPNCRYLASDGKFVYVSSYAGPVGADPHARKGYVAKIDPTTLELCDTCTVGYQPEQMAVCGGKLYVANSGGYMFPDYDSTVSVIDLSSFSLCGSIELAPNLRCLLADPYGRLWACALGDYKTQEASLWSLDPSDGSSSKVEGAHVMNMVLCGDTLYTVGSRLDGSYEFKAVDVRSGTICSENYLPASLSASGKQALVTPYGIAADAQTGRIFITDATDYLTPGRIHCILPATGSLLWSATTGNIPGHIAILE